MILDQIIRLTAILAGLVLAGTLGFALLENWSIFDAVYMTVITISTVGFGEVRELGLAGRAFACCLILLSIAVMSCWTAVVTSMFVEGSISGAFAERKMLRMLAKLDDHAVVCGLSGFSKALIEQLLRRHMSVAVISDDAQAVSWLAKRYPDISVLQRSPMCELALAQANVLTARVVVAATECDLNNLLIAMSCKEIRPDIQVIALAEEATSAGRMKKVGVDEIVCPSLLGGQYAAGLISPAQPGNSPHGESMIDFESEFLAGF